jgi:hypothetical protein
MFADLGHGLLLLFGFSHLGLGPR